MDAEKVERGGGAAGKLLESIWIRLYGSFSSSLSLPSTAQSVGTGRTQQPSLDVCMCMQIQGGGLFKKPLVQPHKCVQFTPMSVGGGGATESHLETADQSDVTKPVSKLV